MFNYTNEDFSSNYQKINSLIPNSKSTQKDIESLFKTFDILTCLIIHEKLYYNLYYEAYDTYFKVNLINKVGISSLNNSSRSKSMKKMKQLFQNFNSCLKPLLIEELEPQFILNIYYQDLKQAFLLLKTNKISSQLLYLINKVLEELNILLYKDYITPNHYFTVYSAIYIAKYLQRHLSSNTTNYLVIYLNNSLKDLEFRGHILEKYRFKLP